MVLYAQLFTGTAAKVPTTAITVNNAFATSQLNLVSALNGGLPCLFWTVQMGRHVVKV
jgi:hypothetical protein